MRGGRDYRNGMNGISECNPFGLQNRHTGCDLQKNTTLPEQLVEILPNGKNEGNSIEGTPVYLKSRHNLLLTAPYMGFKIYNWTLTNIGPGTIKKLSGGGQFDTYMEIETLSDESTDYQISVEVTDQILTATDTKIFTHIVHQIDVPIEIISLDEALAGSCEIIVGNNCSASSTYSIDYRYDTGTVEYQWAVTGAPFVDNLDGTITVASSDVTDVTFLVECIINDSQSNDYISGYYTHTRTLSPIAPDQDLLYDATNIATEFI